MDWSKNTVLIAIAILITLVILNIGDGDNVERSKDACIKSYASRSKGPLGKGIDHKELCGCFSDVMVERKEAGEDVSEQDMKNCLNIHVKEAFLRNCERELVPLAEKEPNLTLSCDCLYDEGMAIAYISFKAGQIEMSPEKISKMDMDLAESCTYYID